LILNAYVLAADPTWLRSSIARYYEHVDRIVVSYDSSGLGWTGTPIAVDACLGILREIDRDEKMTFLPGNFVDSGAPREVEVRQRQSALDAASEGADWVLQIDTDELLPRVSSLYPVLNQAMDAGIGAVEWPMRVLYRRLGRARYAEVAEEDGSVHVEYPGPIAVRSGTTLADGRRGVGAFVRPSPVAGAGGLQLDRQPTDDELRLSAAVELADVIVHNSWARPASVVSAKLSSSSHNQGLRSTLYYLTTWLPARYTWRTLRNLHPFARALWPRLAPFNLDRQLLHPAEAEQ
jgi:hypothetical protein